MDSCLGHQPDDTLVALLVFFAQVLHEVEDELPSKDLVAMHPCHVAELRLPCKQEQSEGRFSSQNWGTTGHEEHIKALRLNFQQLFIVLGNSGKLAHALRHELARIEGRHSLKSLSEISKSVLDASEFLVTNWENVQCSLLFSDFKPLNHQTNWM